MGFLGLTVRFVGGMGFAPVAGPPEMGRLCDLSIMLMMCLFNKNPILIVHYIWQY